MFDLTSSKLLILAIVALLVVGPKDFPVLLRTIGRYVGLLRKHAAEFRSQFDEAMREAELDQMRVQVEQMSRDIEKSVRESDARIAAEFEGAGQQASEALAIPAKRADRVVIPEPTAAAVAKSEPGIAAEAARGAAVAAQSASGGVAAAEPAAAVPPVMIETPELRMPTASPLPRPGALAQGAVSSPPAAPVAAPVLVAAPAPAPGGLSASESVPSHHAGRAADERSA